MASYSVVPKPSVEKDLRALPKPVIARVLKQIEALGEDPFPRRALSWKAEKDCLEFALAIIELSTASIRTQSKS